MEYAVEYFTPEISGTTGQNLLFEIGDPTVIFDMICNRIYATPLRTSIQEYMSNARDSHREAGVPHVPIQIVLPTPLDRSIRIRDFGMGISPDRMSNVFVKLGVSTKRINNSQTGGFGVGAKSAFSYTDNFTIHTIYNGTARTYLAYIGSSGFGELDLVSEEETTERNFTEISFHIKREDEHHLKDIIIRVSAFWDVHPIILNSDLNLDIWQRITPQESKNWGFYRLQAEYYFERSIERFMACCDGILYQIRLPQHYLDIFGESNKSSEPIIFFFGIGEIDLAITRESLQYTQKTKNIIQKRCEELHEYYLSSVKNIRDSGPLNELPQRMISATKTIPYIIYRLDVRLDDGVSLKIGKGKNDSNNIRIIFDNQAHRRYVTRIYDIDEKKLQVLEIKPGIILNDISSNVINDSFSNRLPGRKIRTISKSGYVNYITTPNSRSDMNNALSSSGMDDEDDQIHAFAVKTLISLGVHSVKNLKPVVSDKLEKKVKNLVFKFLRCTLDNFSSVNSGSIYETWDNIIINDKLIVIPYEFINDSVEKEFLVAREQLIVLIRSILYGDRRFNQFQWVKPGNKKSWDNYHKKRRENPEVFDRFYGIVNQAVDQLKYIDRNVLTRMFIILSSSNRQKYTRYVNNFLRFLLQSSAQEQCGITALSESIADKDPDLEDMFRYIQSLPKCISLRPSPQDHLLGDHNRLAQGISNLLFSTWKNIHKNRKQFNIPGSERWISMRWLFSARIQAETIVNNTDRILKFLVYHFPLLYQHSSSDVVEARLSGDIWLSDGLTYMNNKMEKLKNDDENWPYPGELPFIKG